MPHYIEDPTNPGQHIDVIDLLRRNPLIAALPVDPRILDALLKRDSWSRREAVAILAGYDPSLAKEWFQGIPIPHGFMDGTTSLSLAAAGLGNPLSEQIMADCVKLSGYCAGQDMAERKPPAEWLAWAESKGFKPYWLDENEPGIVWRFDTGPKSDTEPQQSGTVPAKDTGEIPGNVPTVASCRLAVKAAWEIECETGKRADAKEVMKCMRQWADAGEHGELTKKLPGNAVEWMTTKNMTKKYDVGACGKTLERWHKSRQ
ncbi:MAG: hypothetical protein M0Z78_05365 [Betaproteobacteria bacterium]|jgi:hypothetical protein|nr:hypothetical protein [Betaproteobacteria bacterium]